MTANHLEFPVLITSAAYVNTELAAEYGELPPSFLPFGHGRLFEAQINMLESSASEIILTIPQSFEPDLSDLEWLESRNVKLLRIPDGLSLGESLSYAVITSGLSGAVGILHGDTLISNFDVSSIDIVGVAPRPPSYTWGKFKNRTIANTPSFLAEDEDAVLCGWFTFSSVSELLRCITLQRGNFPAAIEMYSESIPLCARGVEKWLDFGHLQTFHQARAQARTERAFNSISVANRTVFKSGEKLGKLEDEARWYSDLPPVLRMFTPKFLGWESNGYRIAYEYSPTIHELYVFGALPKQSWEKIVSGCFEFLGACANQAPSAAQALTLDLADQTEEKTLARLSQWCDKSGISLDKEWVINGRKVPSLLRIASETMGRVRETSPLPGVMHGDFCFPNMFYDFREQIVKVIDPRGSMQDGFPSIYGDLRYDLAKFNHSIEGYDQILTKKYTCSRDGNNLTLDFRKNAAAEFIRQVSANFNIAGQSVSDSGISALTVHLFLSMLPLHFDRSDRQVAFLANALRLYSELEG